MRGNDFAIADRATLVRNDGKIFPLERVPVGRERVKRLRSKLKRTYSLIYLFTSKKVAFTLAEVLITLGIIGVVAALTMPNLIANYQKKVWVTQLKKDVNIAQNSIKKYLADEGVENIENSTLVEYLGDTTHNGSMTVKYKFEKLGLNKIKTGKPDFVTLVEGYGELHDITYLSDGSCLLLPGTLPGRNVQWSSGTTVHQFDFLVDVNCQKGPNQPGKDQFRFKLDSYGKLVVNSVSKVSQDDVNAMKELCNQIPNECKEIFGSSTPNFDDLSKYNEKGLVDACRRGQLDTCFDLIVRDDWKMNY